MENFRTIKGIADNRVYLNQPFEVEYWCGRLFCNDLQLMDAVEKVGNSVPAVQKYLENEEQLRRKNYWQSGGYIGY